MVIIDDEPMPKLYKNNNKNKNIYCIMIKGFKLKFDELSLSNILDNILFEYCVK